MTSFNERTRQAWRFWTQWPPFRVLFWLIAVYWVALCRLTNGSSVFYGHFNSLSDYILNIYFHFNELADIYIHLLPPLLAIALPIMIVWRTRAQMTSWQSAIVPDFRRPHLLVAAILACMLFLVMAVAPTALELLVRYHWAEEYRWTFTFYRFSYFTGFGRLQYWRQLGWVDYNFWFLVYNVWPAIDELLRTLLYMAAIGWLASLVSNWVVMVIAWIAAGSLLSFLSTILSRGWVWNGVHYTLFNYGYGPQDDSVFTCGLFVVDLLVLVFLFRRLYRIPVGFDSVRLDERVPWLSRLLVGLKPLAPGAS